MLIGLLSCQRDITTEDPHTQTYHCDTVIRQPLLVESSWVLDSIGHASIWRNEHSFPFVQEDYAYVRAHPEFNTIPVKPFELHIDSPFVFSDSIRPSGQSSLYEQLTLIYDPSIRTNKRGFTVVNDSLIIDGNYTDDGEEPDGFQYSATERSLILNRTYIDVHWIASGVPDHAYLHYYEFHFSRIDTICL